jgi:hypothetical protein
VASGPKVSIALSDRPVALLVVCVLGWHALVSHYPFQFVEAAGGFPVPNEFMVATPA